MPLEQRAARAPADGESERPPWFCGTLVWGGGARGPQCLPPAQGRGGHPGGARSGRRLLPCLSGASRWRSERKVNKAVREARVPRGRPPGCRPGAPPPGCEPARAAPLAVVGKWPSPSGAGFTVPWPGAPPGAQQATAPRGTAAPSCVRLTAWGAEEEVGAGPRGSGLCSLGTGRESSQGFGPPGGMSEIAAAWRVSALRPSVDFGSAGG